MRVAYIVAVIAIVYGLFAQYNAGKVRETILLKNDTLHTQQATITGLHEVNLTLKNSSWVNTSRIDGLVVDVDSIKSFLATEPWKRK